MPSSLMLLTSLVAGTVMRFNTTLDLCRELVPQFRWLWNTATSTFPSMVERLLAYEMAWELLPKIPNRSHSDLVPDQAHPGTQQACVMISAQDHSVI